MKAPKRVVYRFTWWLDVEAKSLPINPEFDTFCDGATRLANQIEKKHGCKVIKGQLNATLKRAKREAA